MFLKLRLIINKYLVQNLSYEILALNGKNAHFKVKFSYVSSILLDLKTFCKEIKNGLYLYKFLFASQHITQNSVFRIIHFEAEEC